MKVAVNYSEEAQRLFNSSLIDVDLFKCPDFSVSLIKNAMKSKSCYVHFGLNVGADQLNDVDWKTLKAMKNLTDTPYVNVHAVAFAKHYPDLDILTNKPIHINSIIDAVVNDIELVAKQVGIENIILENVICRGPGENMLRAITDPEVITEIVSRTGCGFLLDTAHAQMTSICLDLDVYEYISQLPVNKLKELHITGIQKDQNGRLRDSMPMTNSDWELASWSLRKIKDHEWHTPWVVSLEYGGVGPAFEWRSDEKVLYEQLPELYQMVK